MDLFGSLYGALFKVSIVHSISGRLRLSIPTLKKIPKEWQVESSNITDVFQTIKGVKEVNYNYISGSALVIYDVNITDEKTIVNNFKQIAKIVFSHKKQLENTQVNELEETVERMKGLVKLEMGL